MQQVFLEFADSRMIVAVAHDSVYGASNVASAHIADDGAVFALEIRCMYAEPIVIFNSRFNTALSSAMWAEVTLLAPYTES